MQYRQAILNLKIPFLSGGKTCLYKFGALGILFRVFIIFPSHVTVRIANAPSAQSRTNSSGYPASRVGILRYLPDHPASPGLSVIYKISMCLPQD
jgi:hypothetical protein